MPSVELPDTLYRLLNDQSRETGLPLPELIKRAVASYLILSQETASGAIVGVTDPQDKTAIKEVPLPLPKR